MSSVANLRILSGRRVFRDSVPTGRECLWFDRYIQSRNRYKQDLIALLADAITTGPVLELTNGFGTIGVELLRHHSFTLHSVCRRRSVRRFAMRRLSACSAGAYCHFLSGALPTSLDEHSFELIYSVNTLHEWSAPVSVLRSAYSLLRKGGSLVLNDLKRDCDQFITEYIVREMAAVETREGRFHLCVFLDSLASSYTSDQVTALLEEAALGPFTIECEEPMTFTARVRKPA